jgi:hypothetical protein
MSLDLPRVTLAEAAAAAFCLVSAVMVEAVLGRYPAAPAGMGLLLGMLPAMWLYLDSVRPGRSLRRVVWLTDGAWRLEFRDGSTLIADLGAGTRLLGRSLVLHWRGSGQSFAHWLTPWDVDDGQLQKVTVRLACAARLRSC